MRSRTRQISLQECYAILGLAPDADMADVKRAYRRRAFELHPDLNPGNPDASYDFQRLNEAYVALSAVLKHEESLRAEQKKRHGADTDGSQQTTKETAGKNGTASSVQGEPDPEPDQSATPPHDGEENASTTAGKNAKPGHADQTNGTGKTASANNEKNRVHNVYTEHDVLRDLLDDPFARRVFEDIYSELNRQQKDAPHPQPTRKEEKPQAAELSASAESRTVKLHQSNLAWGTSKWSKQLNKGVTGLVKGWLRRQIDEEQSLTLPAANLAPGRRVRLQIRQAISGELKTVEITLPPDFAVGKPIRLRGLGKQVGPWQGDLYLTLHDQ